ncbi:glycosyltransferase [Segetibacter aerophilus]|uniref:glycosyltransferase n=1 Tax=Segetibacter aerophilus TaxID=670293 RepID=UPI0014793C51|nr:glycosyltransferase [Segetibacter aerophilus]
MSIIVPCYNQGRYLPETIGSVRSQTFSDWEIIIIDDGSSDIETKELLGNLNEPKVKIIHTENRGVAAARNTGIESAKGKYILPLDADDLIGKDYLKEAVACLAADIELKVVYSNAKYFGDEKGLISLEDYDPKKMLRQNLIFCTALFRKSHWLKCGGYDEEFLTGWEDWEFWLRLINSERQVHKLPGIHFYYRIKKGSRNANLQNERLKHAEQQLYSKHIKLYRKSYPNPISLIRNYENLLYEQQQFENYKKTLRSSLSYRIGNFVLLPLKYLNRLKKSSV